MRYACCTFHRSADLEREAVKIHFTTGTCGSEGWAVTRRYMLYLEGEVLEQRVLKSRRQLRSLRLHRLQVITRQDLDGAVGGGGDGVKRALVPQEEVKLAEDAAVDVTDEPPAARQAGGAVRLA